MSPELASQLKMRLSKRSVDTHGLTPRGTKIQTPAESALCPLFLDGLRTAGCLPHSTQQSKRRIRETTTPLPSRSASVRDTGAEVADSNSLSSCPQYSRPHISEESPARHGCDQLAHSIVAPPHRGDSAGSEVYAPAQKS